MTKLHIQYSISNYTKALNRLEKSIRSGKFSKFTQYKKQQVWHRLCRYAKQSDIRIKAPIAAACLAAGLSFSSPVSAQSFNQQTGAANPFNGVTIKAPFPTFVDIDGDGDKDAFVGNGDGTISYYKNAGSSAAPVFIVQTGAANPLNAATGGYYSAPAFVDVDGDGDMDAFIGRADGTISYYKNTGIAATPVFVLQTGAANPFNGVDVGSYSSPAFVDIDGDGDKDAFIGKGDGTIDFYKNTGTSAAPVFTLQSGVANPLNGIDVGDYSAPAFVDIDGDGDMDLFVGEILGRIFYYKNTGTATAPVFVSETGTANPFNGVTVAGYSAPSFVDIDGDGDFDAFIGAQDSTISYFKNTSTVLPLQLLSFSGNRLSGYNHLQWKTATEIGTKSFDIEISNDGQSFSKIATVKALGSSGIYSIEDKAAHSGKAFYRLKIVDIDGKFSYSQVIWIMSEGTTISIYPNPVKNIITINIGSSKILQTTAGVYDANGRLLKNILISNYQQSLIVQPFAKGVYQIKFADGTVQSFIKD